MIPWFCVSWVPGKCSSLLPLSHHYLCSVHYHNILETTYVCHYVLARCSSFLCRRVLLLFCVTAALWDLPSCSSQGKGVCILRMSFVFVCLLVVNTTERLKHVSPINKMSGELPRLTHASLTKSFSCLFSCLCSPAFRNHQVPCHCFSNYAVCLEAPVLQSL